MFCVAWAYYFYFVAVGALPAAWGVIYKNLELLVLLQFMLV